MGKEHSPDYRPTQLKWILALYAFLVLTSPLAGLAKLAEELEKKNHDAHKR